LPGNLRWGVTYGLIGASLYVAFVSAVALLSGSTRFDRYGLHLGQIIAAYVAAGVAIGLLLGVLRPWATSPLAWALIGALSGPLFYGAVGVTMDGLSMETVRTALILGVPMGLVCGFGLWWRVRD
jgi:hypothetical protein